jgi:hypothetical protein
MRALFDAGHAMRLCFYMTGVWKAASLVLQQT